MTMRGFPFAFGVAIAICVAGLSVWRPAAQDRCAQMVALLIEDLQDLPMTKCEYSETGQTKVTVTLQVPAKRIRSVEQQLIAAYDMEPLRFACCGFEAHPVTVVVPEDHPLKIGKPRTAYRDIGLSFSVYAFDEVSGDINELGTVDGMLLLRLTDV